MLQVKFTSRPFDKLETQCAVVTSFSDSRPLKGNAALLDWRLNGRLSRILSSKKFSGDFKEALLLPSEGRIKSREILFLGLGTGASFTESSLSPFSHFILEKMAQKKVSDFMISFSDILSDRFEWRNSVRLLVSKLHDFPGLQTLYLCETEECVKDAKRRHMDFGMNVDVSFETLT
ncbi:MAG: M17 family peptidase N-terminal domain-containing protein [Deltaproteobacteria bacterium]|nr:M17 family peptidase N-terminal domain-containing protein [Deltaproteobacteria bacterium]